MERAIHAPTLNIWQIKIYYLTCSSDPRSIAANGFERSNNNTRQLQWHAGWTRWGARRGRCGPGMPPTSRYVTLAVLEPICVQKYSRTPLVFRTLLAHRPFIAMKPHWLAEANTAILLATTGECSSCECLSASALLVVLPVACPYSSLFVTAFRSRRILVMWKMFINNRKS